MEEYIIMQCESLKGLVNKRPKDQFTESILLWSYSIYTTTREILEEIKSSGNEYRVLEYLDNVSKLLLREIDNLNIYKNGYLSNMGCYSNLLKAQIKLHRSYSLIKSFKFRMI